MLNTADKQDDQKSHERLKHVSNLSLAPNDCNPTWIAQRHAIYLMGCICYFLVWSFTDVMFCLWQQLEYLSAMSHLLLVLFRANPEKGEFMPTQLYTDTQLMIKNIFFCVAKEKIINPNGKIHIILLGTDQLETSFSILQTMVGNYANANILQLTTRLSHISKVQNILASNPSWEELETGSQHADHVAPGVWKGDISINSVQLLTC